MRKLVTAIAVVLALVLVLVPAALAATANVNCHPNETGWAIFFVLPGPTSGTAEDFNYLTGGRRHPVIGVGPCPWLSGGCEIGIQHGAKYPWGTVKLTVNGTAARLIAAGCI